MATLVKGIKYGTLAQYKALSTKDPDTLYFITDRGLIFRGESIVIPRTVVNATVSGSGAAQVATFTIQTYTAGQNEAQLPETLTFTVSTQAAVNAVIGTINQSLDTHRIVGGSGTEQDPYVYADGKATGSSSGHVTLTDTVDMATPANNAAAASGGTAVTPKGVYDAINAVLPGLAGAMQFKGTVASAAAIPQTYKVGEVYVASAAFTIGSGSSALSVEAGDMLIATTARTTASNTPDPAHWAVVEQNLTGAVTAQNNLPTDALIVGNGSKTAKTLANGMSNEGKHLRQNAQAKPEWMRHAIHYATCSTASDNLNKKATTADAGGAMTVLVSGTLVAVRFNMAVEQEDSANLRPVELDVDNTGFHIVLHKADDPTVVGSIAAGDTALFIYDNSSILVNDVLYRGSWRLLAVDHRLAAVALSGSFNDLIDKPQYLSFFNNDIFAFGTCNAAASATDHEVTLLGSSGFTATEGAVLVVKFTNRVRTGSTLQIQGDSSSQASINDFVGYASGSVLSASGDTCIFIYGKPSASATDPAWNLVGIHRPIDNVVTAGSTNLVTSGAVASAINNAIGQAINKRNFYGVCNTAASIAAKQAIGTTSFELNSGAIVTVKFTNAVTASGATLALSSDLGVNYTDPKYIYYDGQLLATDVIFAGDTCTFIYTGAQFNLIAFAREGLKWDSLPPEPVV